ncbi:hypothetical protein BDV23DRAFT_189187 [Aspergillus alliaceus]|uniref:Uncharacterized protein n=1 Tax=Petromyces alliaceus TaxID=209559 RepID=A0A5N7BRM8_PETAA|nr:hypothetical protein BDV23DRAFT_189187 [Aspergillus alliaceus]
MQFVRQSATREKNGTAIVVPLVLEPQPLRALYRVLTAVWYFGNSDKPAYLLADLRSDEYDGTSSAGVYFEMTYGLWNAFFLTTLPHCLDEDDLSQVSVLCNTLTDFILSGRCLRWVEMAIIINCEGALQTF